MGQPAGGLGVEEARLGRGLAEEDARSRAGAARRAAGRARRGCRSRLHLGGDAGGDLFGGAGSGDERQRAGNSAASARKPSRSRAWKPAPEPLEAVLGAAAGEAAAEADVGRQVEDQREVGLEADDERVQRVDGAAQPGAGGALVDAGRSRRSGRRSPWRRGRAPGGWCARDGRGARR